MDRDSRFSRREWLRRAGLAGASATVVPMRLWGRLRAATVPIGAAPQLEVWETLTAAEAGTLAAMVARLIPSDENGPGALEAGAARYIDRALGDALASSREAYRAGLAAVDGYARASKGASFEQLPPRDQDAVLSDMERGVATGFTPASSSFFTLVRAHTIQGTFCDPYYGGNASFVGWDLLGYPGVRLAVSPDDQRLDPQPARTHTSAYDDPMFSKPSPTGGIGGRRSGD